MKRTGLITLLLTVLLMLLGTSPAMAKDYSGTCAPNTGTKLNPSATLTLAPGETTAIPYTCSYPYHYILTFPATGPAIATPVKSAQENPYMVNVTAGSTPGTHKLLISTLYKGAGECCAWI